MYSYPSSFYFLSVPHRTFSLKLCLIILVILQKKISVRILILCSVIVSRFFEQEMCWTFLMCALEQYAQPKYSVSTLANITEVEMFFFSICIIFKLRTV